MGLISRKPNLCYNSKAFLWCTAWPQIRCSKTSLLRESMSSPFSNTHMSQSALSGWCRDMMTTNALSAFLKSALVDKFVSRVARAFQMPLLNETSAWTVKHTDPWVISRNAIDAGKIASVKRVSTTSSKEELLRRINRRPMPDHWAVEKYSADSNILSVKKIIGIISEHSQLTG